MEWLNNLKLNLDQEHLINALIVTGIELAILLVTYLAISFLVRFSLKRIHTLASLQQIADKLTSIIGFVSLIIRLVLVLGLFAALGLNGYQMIQGVDVMQFTLDQIAKIPPGFWSGLSISFAKILILIIAARYLIRWIDKGLVLAREKAVNYKQLRSNDQSVARVFDRLMQIQKVVVWITITFIATRLFPFANSLSAYVVIVLKVYLVVSIGLLIVNTIAAIVDSLDGLSKRYAESSGLLSYYNQLSSLVPLLRKTLEYIVYAAVATLVLSQLSFISHLAKFGPGVIQGIGVIFLARVAAEVVSVIMDRMFLHDGISDEERQRGKTIFPIIKSVLAAIIYFIAVVIVLRGFGFDPIPLLAGAGILGMVVGLGAQSLINDMVSGFFIIFENTYRVGDFIQTQNARGIVESIALRTTRVRSPDGQLHILQNGKLGDVVNYSNAFTNAIVDVGVSANTDLGEAYDVLRRVGKELAESNPDVLELLVIDGVEDFSGPEIVIRTRTKVKPGKHNSVARKLREKIKEAFETARIEMPFAKRYRLA